MPSRDGVGRLANSGTPLPVDGHAAGVAPVGGIDQPRRLGAAGAEQSGKAGDLALADGQRNVAHAHARGEISRPRRNGSCVGGRRGCGLAR